MTPAASDQVAFYVGPILKETSCSNGVFDSGHTMYVMTQIKYAYDY
jgi:hypothetical protein